MNILKKKYLPLFLLAGFLTVGCKENKETPEPAIFSGKLKNTDVDSVAVHNEDFLAWIRVDEEERFRDTLKIQKEGYYTFQVGNEITTIFLSPQGEHSVNLNAEQFDESLDYSGQNYAENNYLAEKFLLSEKMSIAPDSLKSMSEDSFLSVAENIKQKYLDLLPASGGINSSFRELEQKAIYYKDRMLRETYVMNSDRGYHKALATSPSTKNILPEELHLDNSEDYSIFADFRRLVNLDFYKTVEYNKKSSSYGEAALNYIKKYESQNIKDALIRSMSYSIRAGAEDLEEIYNGMLSLSSDAEFKKRLSEKFRVLQQLKKGSASPEFSFENHEGGKTSLQDLVGNYVYIDVWATWCAPCIQEIPFLKKLEEEFQGKKIRFVSISIDNKEHYDKWRTTVSEKELGGIQLFADRSWNSKFVKKYAVDAIPRFILVDPEGLIVSADAPRPSDPALLEIFKSLNI